MNPVAIIDWQLFHLAYFNQNTIFVKETETEWMLYTYEGIVLIKCVVVKKESAEENIMFVDRYFSGYQNVKRVIDFYDGLKARGML